MALLKDEAAFKKLFKASVRMQKGYSLSLSAPVLPGLPDLYVVMPGYMPVLLEAKIMKVKGQKFNRKIEYSPMQEKYAKELNRVRPFAMLGLVCLQFLGVEYCILSPISEDENRLSNDKLGISHIVSRQANGFDVNCLFMQTNIPRLALHVDTSTLVQDTYLGPTEGDAQEMAILG